MGSLQRQTRERSNARGQRYPLPINYKAKTYDLEFTLMASLSRYSENGFWSKYNSMSHRTNFIGICYSYRCTKYILFNWIHSKAQSVYNFLIPNIGLYIYCLKCSKGKIESKRPYMDFSPETPIIF